MPPLTRQRTLDSILSWWSDSNPPGPTISLHAATKPLMGFMYDRQVSAFISAQRGTAPSKEAMEIYASYLAWKYVWTSTKTAILGELANRVASDDEWRTAVLDSPIWKLLEEFLASPDSQLRSAACRLIGPLAAHGSAWNKWPCATLVSLLRDENPDVIERAAEALHAIVVWPQGATAAADAQMIDCLPGLLDSANGEVRSWTCQILGELASHGELTAMAVLDVNPCARLVPLLRDKNMGLVESAIYALRRIAQWRRGCQAAIEAGMLERVAELLHSQNPQVRRRTCETLGRMAFNRPTAVAVLEVNPCPQLVRLLRDAEVEVIESACYALCRITELKNGAQAAADANMLEYVPDLLGSPDAQVRRWTCEMLGQLANYKFPVVASVIAQLSTPLVSLLR
ncbi:armadillo-type protein [Mycena latifolia]|nr:armadillo-type protein [Mycena latifolia]